MKTSCGALLLLAAAAGAAGQVQYRFVFERGQYYVEPGETVAVRVYLEEEIQPGTPSLIVDENGVASIGAGVRRIDPLPGDPARFNGPGAVAPNTRDFFDASDPLFGPVIEVAPGGDHARVLVFARDAGVTGLSIFPETRRIWVADFRVTMGNAIGQTTVFKSEDFDETEDTVTWTNLIPLDGPNHGVGSTETRLTVVEGPCYPDCETTTGPRVLDIFDFLCFQVHFAALDPYACDCDTGTGPGVCDIFDFLCFQNTFAAGCP